MCIQAVILVWLLTSYLPGLAENGSPQRLYYSACDKAQWQGNQNSSTPLTIHQNGVKQFISSQVSLLELGGAGHFDSEMLTFN